MSYSEYTRRLHFGSVSDSIQAMKDNEFNRITNPMDSQQLSLDSDISKLTASLQSDEASDSATKTIDDAISGGGGAIESMATMKKLYSKFKDAKTKVTDKVNEVKGKVQDKVDEIKGKAQDKVDEIKGKAQDKVDEVNDKMNGDKPTTEDSQPQEIEMRNFRDDSDVVDGPSELNEVTNTDLAPSTTTVPENELGSGTFTNTEPSGTGSGDIEMQTFSSNAPETEPDMFTGTGENSFEMQTFSNHNAQIAEADPSANVDLEQHLTGLENQETTATKTLSSDTDAVTKAAAETGEAGGEVAEDAAVAGEDVLESTGEALDLTGIGAAVGILINIGGLVLGAVAGSEDETKDTSVENNIAVDQQKVDSLKQQELNIKSQISQQTFTGANVVPNISSTTLDNVTSSSF